MRSLGSIFAGLLVILAVIVLIVVGRRLASPDRNDRHGCANHLLVVATALGEHRGRTGRFPSAVAAAPDLPFARRPSWYVELLSSLREPELATRFDAAKAWDDPVNVGPAGTWLEVLRCPARAVAKPPPPAPITTYVGIAGIGSHAPLLTRQDPKAGVFGYESSARFQDITDGASTTMMVIETAKDNGPWAAGGPSTVRGLDPALPYIGSGRQFGGLHSGGAMAAFADGSVRFISDKISPSTFEALATIAGHEPVGNLQEIAPAER
jgi:prepilin-type processing-associated H-X9-DG protein